MKNINAEPQRPIVAPRWPTRVFAIECMLKIIAACDGNETHFQLDTAKALRQKGSGLLFRSFYAICVIVGMQS